LSGPMGLLTGIRPVGKAVSEKKGKKKHVL